MNIDKYCIKKHVNFSVFDSLWHEFEIRELLHESNDLGKGKAISLVSTEEPDYKNTGRGAPGKSQILNLGEKGLTFFQSKRLLSLLYDLTKMNWKLNDECSCYIIYRNEGDYIGIHRDTTDCELTVLIYIQVYSQNKSKSPYLLLYPEHTNGPIFSESGKNLCSESIMIENVVGRTIVMFGSMVPHYRPPLGKDQIVKVAAACYQAID